MDMEFSISKAPKGPGSVIMAGVGKLRNNWTKYIQQGLVAHRGQRLPEAQRCYEQAIKLQPTDPLGYRLLGTLCLQMNRLQQGATLLEHALSLNPVDVEIMLDLACYYREHDQPQRAACLFEQAAAQQPNNFELYRAMAEQWFRLQCWDKAQTAWQRAYELSPSDAGVLYKIVQCCERRRQYSEAATYYRHLLNMVAPTAKLLAEFGQTLILQGNVTEAQSVLEQAVGMEPSNRGYHALWSWSLLLAGNLTKGFREYEYRPQKVGEITPPTGMTGPVRWSGQQYEGKNLLILDEQGLGDSLMFARFLPLVKQRGGKLIVQVQPALLALYTSSFPEVDVWLPADSQQAIDDIDFYLPEMSMAHILAVTEHTLPRDGYLRPSQEKLMYWQAKVRAAVPDGALRVGLVWSGNPQFSGNEWRSFTFEQFLPLVQTDRIVFFSLQKGAAADQLTQSPQHQRVVDYTADIHDFADTAAIIDQLDLVISVDTAVAHLAGALGATVWTIVPHIPEWRWQIGRSDCIWYPHMTLFRQPDDAERGQVIQVIANCLAEIAQYRLQTDDQQKFQQYCRQVSRQRGQQWIDGTDSMDYHKPLMDESEEA